jgi:purine/pyrimidine-nucleoside phosphorylase
MITVNEYFNGSVKSLGYQTSDGKATVGIIDQGEFEFSTADREIMTIIEGELAALLPGAEQWETFSQGQRFEVPANASFKVKSAGQTAYLCQFR